MSEFIATQDFKWAHQNVRVEEFTAGQTIVTEDPDLIRVAAEEEGWMEAAGKKKPAAESPAPQSRSKKQAPENKAVDSAPENK